MAVIRAAQSAEELALLREIVADLTDETALAVYCDWLDDRDDPRGPFLREFLRAFAARGPLPPNPPGLNHPWANVLALPIRRRLREGCEHPDPRIQAILAGNVTNHLTPLEPYLTPILRTPVPCLEMSFEEWDSPEEPPIGSTFANGLPDLPANMLWPTSLDFGEEWPMRFLFQVNLADLAGTFAEGLLPPNGLLSVFQYRDHIGSPTVFYTPPGVNLRREITPDPYKWSQNQMGDEVFSPTPVYEIVLVDGLKFPLEIGEVPLEIRLVQMDQVRDLCTDLIFNRYRNIIYPEHFFCTRLSAAGRSIRSRHGFSADDFKGRPYDDYVELLAIESTDEPYWMFSEGDGYQVFVPAEDARLGRFDRALSYEM